MNSVTEVYLARLRQRLSRRWTEPEVEDAVQEIRVHLADSASQVLQEGITESDASLEALRRIGSDRLLAENLIRAKSGIDKRSIWRIGWLPALILFLLLTLPLTLESVQGMGLFDLIRRVLAWLAFFFLISFPYASWRSRRLLLLPMATAFVIGAVVIGSSTFFGGSDGFTVASKQSRSDLIKQMGAHVEKLGRDIENAKTTMAGGAMPRSLDPAKVDAPVPSVIVDLTTLPYIPYEFEISRRPDTILSPVASPIEARKLWKENGAAYLAKIERSAVDEKLALESWKNLKPSPPTVGRIVMGMVQSSGVFLAVLMVLNSIVLSLVWARKQLIQRRWRPSAPA